MPPRSVIGHVDDVTYSAWLGDALENIPNLLWPQAIAEYAVMRRDPTLSAILSSYYLQVLRATWAFDGTGCRPEVTALVADDLGVPIAGVDRPSAARVRGVQWSEHLQAALLCLPYGHFGFELQADVSSGMARLAGLWERAPWTIGHIHVQPKTGVLLGVTQDGFRATSDVPQIKADRLAWYTHGKEGANHAGTSLLRPAWATHLVKREILRATATAHRRFSMGVPTIEWVPGSGPTPQQHSQAQQAASAARVGETAGMALPPGATLKLVGLSGAVPDNLALLSWLDRQMSRMALMPHIELGQGTTGGSRALGDTFVDSWTLSLQAIGSSLASQATRQIVARMVEWNFGPDEPVPALTVSGIGTRREVTSESLKQLLDAGALSADPGLEAWIRREWRLPEREGMTQPAPSVKGDTITAANRKRTPRKQPADGQMSLPIEETS